MYHLRRLGANMLFCGNVLGRTNGKRQLLGIILGGKMSFESGKGVAILVYLAFLSAVAYALWGMLLKHNPVSKVSVFTFTTPIFGTLLSLLLLPESSGVEAVNLVVTLLLVSLGIFLLNYQPKQKEITQK